MGTLQIHQWRCGRVLVSADCHQFPANTNFCTMHYMHATNVHPLARRVSLLGERLTSFALTRERRILRIAVISFILIFSSIGAWKLWSFSYNALDLAIYTQVAHTSLRGDLFGFTIHPHSYLGDHFEVFFAFVWLIFAVFRHPLTLIVLQSLALAVAAYPLARMAERFVGKPWHLLIALAYLANPMIQNMALFEFHLLPFAIPLLSFALLAYLERRYARYLLFLVLALTVREDVALVALGMGILALVERRSWKWSVVPLVLGAAWFFAALKLTAFFSGYAQNKFLKYYGWLGTSIGEMVRNSLLRPWEVLRHLFSLSNLGFLAAVFLPFAYLPLFRLRWLIPAIFVFLELLLVQSSGELLVEIHYPALLIPFFIVATAAAFAVLLHPPERGLFRRISSERAMAIIVFVVVIVYSMVVIGPLARAVPVLARGAKISDRVNLERAVVRSLPHGGTVAGFDTITELTDRPRLYSLHYVFLGKKQFSDEPYIVPDDAGVVLLELRDFLFYQLLYLPEENDNEDGYARIRDFLKNRGFAPTLFVDRFAVFERNPAQPVAPLYSTATPALLQGNRSPYDELTFLGWSSSKNVLQTTTRTVGKNSFMTLPFSVTFEKNQASNEFAQLELRFLENGKELHRILLPFGGGMYPTSDWKVGQAVTSRYDVLVPRRLAEKKLEVELRVLRVEGSVALNGVRALELRYRQYDTLGTPIRLGAVQVPTSTR